MAEENVELANSVAIYMLNHSNGSSIKRADIMKKVLSPENSKQFKTIMAMASDILEKVAGLHVEEVKSSQYILVNAVDNTDSHIKCCNYESLSLLMYILSLILMNNGCVDEDLLWEFLSKLSIDREAFHPIFDVKKLIYDEWVKHGYLNMKTIPNDPPTQEFTWGFRATHELSSMKVLEFVSHIYGDNIKPQHWTSQYRKSLEQQQEEVDS